jgi:prolyl oligopeptidase
MFKIKRYNAKAFYETVSYRGAAFSPDESNILVTSDKTGIYNLYNQPIDCDEPVQLTHSMDNAIMGVDYFPHDERILYSSDEGGNELNHVYVRERDGEVIDLTPGKGLKASFLNWSGDLKKFRILSNERDPKYFDLYSYDTETYERTLVYENMGEFGNVSGVSKDGRWVGLIKIRNNADNDIYIWDSENRNKPPKLITRHEGNVSHSVADFSPDNKRLLYLSDGEGEFKQLWVYEIESGSRNHLEGSDWDISYSRYSRNGRYRVTGVNVDARTEITVRDENRGEVVALPFIPQGDISGVNISMSSRYMAFYVNGDTSPSNLYILDITTGEHRRLTSSLNPEIDESHLVNGSVVRYSSFDDLPIPALLYKPHDASPKNKVPAVIYVHGGPGGQTRLGYSADRQFLLNHGYAVLAVNNRGSSGYGKTFYHMDDLKHGDVDLKDCVWGRRYLESLDWVDGGKVAIMGGSYGGYMVAAALAFTPEEFDAGIDIFGVTNWVRTLKSIPSWWEAQRESLYAELGNPYEDEDKLRAKSPLFHAANIVRPLLVVQGSNDPRVLQVESDELVEAARKNGVPVEYIVFPDEGHGFRVKANRVTAAEAYLKFLDEHL